MSFGSSRHRVQEKHSRFYATKVKRAVDIVGAASLLMVLAPVLLTIMIAQLAFGGKGDIFYRHSRIGKDGKSFGCLKFRTMSPDADKILREILETDPVARQQWEATQKFERDPRITEIGHLLRKTSMDELPQLWNVIRGEMSLVGPRPVTAGEMQRWYETLGGANAYKTVRPGITGLWQVSGRSGTSYEYRVDLDTKYMREISFENDARILLRTFGVVIRQDGAC